MLPLLTDIVFAYNVCPYVHRLLRKILLKIQDPTRGGGEWVANDFTPGNFTSH